MDFFSVLYTFYLWRRVTHFISLSFLIHPPLFSADCRRRPISFPVCHLTISMSSALWGWEASVVWSWWVYVCKKDAPQQLIMYKYTLWMCAFVCSGAVKEWSQPIICPESVKETPHPGHQPARPHPVRAPHHDGGSQSFHHQVRLHFYGRWGRIYSGLRPRNHFTV